MALNIMNMEENYSDSDMDVDKEKMLEYKGYFKENEDNDEDEPKYYEHGAHFPYLYLYQRLEMIYKEREEKQETGYKKSTENNEEEKINNNNNYNKEKNRSRNRNNLNFTHNNENDIYQPEFLLRESGDINNQNFSAMHLRQKGIIDKIKSKKENLNLYESIKSKNNQTNTHIEEEKNYCHIKNTKDNSKNKQLINKPPKTNTIHLSSIQHSKLNKRIKVPNSNSVIKKVINKRKEIQLTKGSFNQNSIPNNKDKKDILNKNNKNSSKILASSINNILMGYKYKKGFNFSPKQINKLSVSKVKNKISLSSLHNNKVSVSNNTFNMKNMHLDLSIKNINNFFTDRIRIRNFYSFI